MANENLNEVTPDTLMERFQGSGLKTIILFTLVVHIVVIGGSSVPYVMKKVFGAKAAEMTQEERIKAAVQEATVAIRDIAADYGLNPQEVSDQFSGGGSRTQTVQAETEPADTVANNDADPGTPAETEREKSDYEKDLEVKAEGPAMPKLEDDIF